MSHPIALSPTLYVNNIPDNLPLDDVKRELYYLFSAVAPVVDIQARKGKSRGKAWVSFPTKELAQVVQKQFDGYSFLGKQISIEFAKKQSKSLDEYFRIYKFKQTDGKQELKKEEKKKEEIKSNLVQLTGFPPKVNIRIIELLCKQNKGYQQVQKEEEAFIAQFDTYENAIGCKEKLDEYAFPGGHTIHAQLYFKKTN